MTSFSGSLKLPGGAALRFSRPSDQDFLLKLFMAARPWFDWTTLPADGIRALYEDQMRLTRMGAGAAYPEHLDFIVERTGQDIGHLVIDLGYSDWHINFLELHPEARGKGIGRDIVQGLQAAAAGVKLPLTVSTPDFLAGAVQFYARLGFGLIFYQQPMVHLGWCPPGMPWRWPVPQPQPAIS
ncbi:MAG: GNAT family N-acetyltransferase [Actinomycetota bacterium]